MQPSEWVFPAGMEGGPRYALQCTSHIIAVDDDDGDVVVAVGGRRTSHGIRYPNDAIASEYPISSLLPPPPPPPLLLPPTCAVVDVAPTAARCIPELRSSRRRAVSSRAESS